MKSTPKGGSAAGAHPPGVAPGGGAASAELVAADGPYGAAQQRLTAACAEADQLVALAEQEQRRLRDARRARAAFERESEQGLALADPRHLADAKSAAHALYRERVGHATARSVVLDGTAEYLRELDKLNRAARRVVGQSGTWSARVRALDEQVNQAAMTAEAARVAAQTARQECNEARRALVRQDEALADDGQATLDEMARPPIGYDDAITPIEALLQGNRDIFRALVGRLAEEVGLDARRLQLLLLELREGLFERARAAAVLDFAPGNRFWAQFTPPEARAVAAALEVLGRGFDGRQGWRDDRPAEPRELAMAVSMAGQDPRMLRVKPVREDLAALWVGTKVDAVAYLRERSPDLALETFEPSVGPRAEGLTELWDNWGRLRRLMLSPELVGQT